MMMQSDTSENTLPDAMTRTLELELRELENWLVSDRQTADISQPLDTSRVSTAPIAGLADRIAELDQRLPVGWTLGEVRRWCAELAQSLRQLGLQALDAMTPAETEAFEDRWGIPVAQAFKEGAVGRVIREFYAIHLRDEAGISCADFAAANAPHMGPFLGTYANSIALSSWDIYAVETANGGSARLRSLRTGDRHHVHTTLHEQTFERKTFAIVRLVSIKNLNVATSVVPCPAECTIATLRDLRRRFQGRNPHAFMRRQGAGILLHEILRALDAEESGLRDHYRDCTAREVVALHAMHSAVEVAVEEGRLLSNVTAIGDVVGWVEVVESGVRLVIQRGDETWEFRRASADQLDATDCRWLEKIGLRPRLHGAVVPDGRVPAWSIAAAEAMVTRLA